MTVTVTVTLTDLPVTQAARMYQNENNIFHSITIFFSLANHQRIERITSLLNA